MLYYQNRTLTSKGGGGGILRFGGYLDAFKCVF